MPAILLFPSDNLLAKVEVVETSAADDKAVVKRRIHADGKSFQIEIETGTLARLKLSPGWIAANLGRAIGARRDSNQITREIISKGGRLSLATDGSLSAPVGFLADGMKILIHPALGEIRHRGTAAAFISAGAAVLLGETFGDSAGLPKTRREEATRLFLLILAENLPAAGEVRSADLNESLAPVLPGDEPLRKMILKKFTEFSASPAWHNYTAAAERTRVFLFPAAYGRLDRREKRSALVGGILAWHDFLLFGLLRLIPFIARQPYFIPARMVLRGWIGERDLFTGGAARRLKRALGRGRIVKATEAFWAGWNPRLTAIILKPVFRMLGGNRRPFLATVGTFAFTAIIVHPLWITLSVTAIAAVLYPFFPSEVAAARILHPINFILHGIVIGFWLGWGLIVGFAKWRRTSVARHRSKVKSKKSKVKKLNH